MSADNQHLYALIYRHFNLEELQNICSLLGTDFDDLFGENRATMVQNLIQRMERHGRLGDLAKNIHSLRPNLLVDEFECYFRDPSLEAYEVMKPPQSSDSPLRGDACGNIRSALKILGYGENDGDAYDETLSDLVFQFQRDYNHESIDGHFGPGTRRLLTRVFIEKYGTYHLRRWVDPTDRHKYLTKLRERLAKHFNEGELKTLCFDLGFDYDDLPDTGRDNKVRELVKYLERRNRIPELVKTCQEQRPLVTWTGL
jgi:hypothetical protein